MNKKINLIIGIGILVTGLTGCNNNDSSMRGISCYHSTPCKTFTRHEALLEYERETNINSDIETNINSDIESDRDTIGKYDDNNIYTTEEYNNNTNYSTSYIENETSYSNYYKVMAGSYQNKQNANNNVYELSLENIDSYISECVVNGNVMYRVVTGSFSNKNNAQEQCDMLKRLGYDAFIIKENNN